MNVLYCESEQGSYLKQLKNCFVSVHSAFKLVSVYQLQFTYKCAYIVPLKQSENYKNCESWLVTRESRFWGGNLWHVTGNVSFMLFFLMNISYLYIIVNNTKRRKASIIHTANVSSF